MENLLFSENGGLEACPTFAFANLDRFFNKLLTGSTDSPSFSKSILQPGVVRLGEWGYSLWTFHVRD